jgi:hypothetical protein
VQPLLASNWSRNQIDPKPEIKTRRWRRQQNPCPYDQHREAPVLGRQSVTGFGQRPTGELEHSDVLDSFFSVRFDNRSNAGIAGNQIPAGQEFQFDWT